MSSAFITLLLLFVVFLIFTFLSGPFAIHIHSLLPSKCPWNHFPSWTLCAQFDFGRLKRVCLCSSGRCEWINTIKMNTFDPGYRRMKGKSIEDTETSTKQLTSASNARRCQNRIDVGSSLHIGWGNVCCASRAVPHQHHHHPNQWMWRIDGSWCIHAFELRIQNALDTTLIWRFRRIETFLQPMRSTTHSWRNHFYILFFVRSPLIRCIMHELSIILLEHRIRARRCNGCTV